MTLAKQLSIYVIIKVIFLYLSHVLLAHIKVILNTCHHVTSCSNQNLLYFIDKNRDDHL